MSLKYLTGGLKMEVDGELRRIALVGDDTEQERVLVELPMDRAFGHPPSARLLGHTVDEVKQWAADSVHTVKINLGGSEYGAVITCSDELRGTISGAGV